MSNQILNQKNKKYDLEERTAVFGEEVIKFVKSINLTTFNRPIIT